jgi:hypothetical protein
VYLYDFETKKERKLTSFSTKGSSEFLPAIWRGKVSFLRSYGKYREDDYRRPILYTHSVDGNETSERQSQGGVKGLNRIAFTGVDLYGQRLAFTRHFQGTAPGGTSQMRVSTLGSGSRLLSQRFSGLTQRIQRSPQFHRGRVLWTEQCAADLGGCRSDFWRFWRSRIATDTDVTYSDAPRALISTAFILDSVYWIRAPKGRYGSDNVNTCQSEDPPDPNSRCLLQTAFVTFSPRRK